MKLSVVVRSRMKEEKICTLSVKNGAKLNLLRVGSDYLAFPVFVVRLNRKELYKSYDLYDALKCFRSNAFDTISLLNELFSTEPKCFQTLDELTKVALPLAKSLKSIKCENL